MCVYAHVCVNMCLCMCMCVKECEVNVHACECACGHPYVCEYMCARTMCDVVYNLSTYLCNVVYVSPEGVYIYHTRM